MPIGNVLVGDPGCDIEHDDTALSVDVVPISETPELLLSCGIPDIELYPSVILEYHKRTRLNPGIQIGTYCREPEGVNLNTEGCNVLLLKFSGQMALDEGSLLPQISCRFWPIMKHSRLDFSMR